MKYSFLLVLSLCTLIFISADAQDPTLNWAFSLNGSTSPSAVASVNKVVKDANGYSYITGSFTGTVDFDPGTGTATRTTAGGTDIFLAKYDGSGNYVWAIGVGGSSNNDIGYSLSVDGSGNIYLTGSYVNSVVFSPTITLNSGGAQDIFLAKYNSSGTLQWVNGFGIGGPTEIGTALVLDGSGNVIITGVFSSANVDFDPGVGVQKLTYSASTDIFIAKYDGSGNYLWAKGIGGGLADYSYSLALDGNDNLYITGSFTGTADFDPSASTNALTSAGGTDIFIAKYDGFGNYLWANRVGSTLTDIGKALALDGSGNVYVTGSFINTVDFDPSSSTSNLVSLGAGSTNLSDIFIAKYDISGNYVWAKGMGGYDSDNGSAIVLDGSGNVFITGTFYRNAVNNTTDFDPGAGTVNLTSVGVNDIFIGKYDASGAYVWAKSFGGASNDYGNSVVLDASGNLILAGGFNGTIDFDPGSGSTNLTATGIQDIVIASYASASASNTAGAASSTPTLCINTALTNITHSTTGATGIGTATGLPAGVIASWSSNTITISGTPTESGTFNYSIPLTGGSGSVNATGTITVTAANTAGSASISPSICINTALTNITHATTGATGIGTATGLPSGVTAAWASSTITISGTPTASGTFNYSIPLTGGCGSVNASGTITVTAANTAGSASISPSICINTALTNITHATTGATGIGTATGLPSGVTAAWASSTITISGTPTASGTFNYSIPLTGGCGTVNATGTIIVGATAPTVTLSASTTTVCAGSSATLTASGATTYVWSPSTGLSSTTGASVIASPTTATTYSVVGTTNGCSSTGGYESAASYSSVSFGTYHVLAVKSNGTLWGWGNNFYNEMGNGNTTNLTTPTQIGTNTNWSKVAAAGDHSHAITTDGKLWGWGRQLYGFVGDGSSSNTSRSTPIQIGTATNWSSIYGSHNTNAIKSDGTAWVWGWGEWGQLGVGNNTINNTSPQQMGVATWTKLAGAYGFELGIKTNGTLWSWGLNNNGWLGLGDNTDRNTPTQVGSSSNWTDIITNNNASHVFGLKSDGTVWAWGSNANYQLGDGTATNRNAPVQILSGSTWKSIAAGDRFSIAVKSDGTLWGWGNNADGAVGDGTTTNKNNPVQIGSSTDWATVNTTQRSSFAFKTDGTLWGWGFNGKNELANGTTTNSLSPISLSISVATTGIAITVTTAITASAASSSPTLYINSALTNITHTTTGATGIGTATGLPSGVSAAWASNTITISGTPTVAGIFNYSIPLTGGCGSNATGTITVASVVINSSASSNTICAGTSVTFTATPTGASSPSYQWKKNGVIISGETASTYTTTSLSNNDAVSVDMTASGFSSNGSIVSSNLVLNLDAGNATSYPGTGTTWTDLSGSGNNGSFVGSLSYSSSEGGSVVFSGSASNDYVSIANSSSLNLTTAGTMSIWINPSSLTQRSTTNLIGRTIDGAPNGQSYYLYWTGGNITGIIQNGGVYKSISTPVPTVLGWYNYVFSWGNGYLKLYKNGEQAATPIANTMNAQSLTTTVNIGGYIFGGAGGNQNTFNGKIPIVHIYGRSLSDAEVLQNFNAQKSRFLSTPISSNSITTTVTAVNTAGTASSTPTVNINAAITNITHSTTGATGIGTAIGLPSGVTASWASNTITISGTPTASGTYNYSIPLTGGCGSVNATGTITVISTYTWSSPGVNSLWSNANNWSTGSVPPAGVEILISSGSVQLDLDYSVGGRLTLSGTGTLTINAGKTLSVPSGGIADFGGKLVTFKSDATGTGQMGVVAGTLNNATNVLVERYIPAGRRAFRFFGSPVRTITTTIKDNWMEGATPGVLSGYPYRSVSVYNPNLGYGTLITGTGGNTNGFDASQTNNPSLFTFNNTTGAWVTVTNTSDTIAVGSAYRMMVRGDRSYGITASTEPTGGATILRTTGTMAQGQLTSGTQLPALSQSASGWSFMGNPYQSVVDMASADVVKNNLTEWYYIWDPRMGTRGAYVAFNLNPLVLSSNNVLSAVNRYVQPGQAFFVQNTTAGSNSIVFKEAAKGAASNQTATFARNNTRAGAENGYTIDATAEKAEPSQTLAVNYASLSAILYYTDSLATGAAATDATRAIFGSQFSNIVDANDGRKFTNLDETMAIKQGTNLLSMELRGLPDSSTIIPLNITQYVDKKYTMRLFWDEKLSTDTLIAYLRDKYTNKETEVKKTGNTDVEYLLDADAKSSAADRFEIIFKRSSNQVTAVINYDNGQYIKIYPNPVRTILNIDFDLGQNRLVDMKVYDMAGRLVMDRPGMRKGSTVTMSSLAKGTYNVKIWASNGKLLMSEKIIKD